MSQQNPHDPFSLPNSSAISRFRRVVLTAGVIALAGANQRGFGVTQAQTQTTDMQAELRSLSGPGTRTLVASGAIAQYADIYAADNGMIAATGVKKLGITLEAATNSGDEIECIVSEPSRLEPLYVATAASAAVTTTTAETLFSNQASIEQNTLKPGDRLRIRFQGIVTAQNSTDTLALKLYIGGLTGTVLMTEAAQDVGTNDVFDGEFEIVVRTNGATGTIVGTGTCKSVAAGAGTATYKDAILASTAIDTTAAQVVGLSATWSTNNAGNSCRLDILDVDRIAG